MECNELVPDTLFRVEVSQPGLRELPGALSPLDQGRSDQPTRIFAAGLRLYARSLRWCLGHRRIMLAATILTASATIWLYVVVPKGFLPIQDTGLIAAVSEGGPEVSYTDMRRLQQRVAVLVAGAWDDPVDGYQHGPVVRAQREHRGVHPGAGQEVLEHARQPRLTACRV